MKRKDAVNFIANYLYEIGVDECRVLHDSQILLSKLEELGMLPPSTDSGYTDLVNDYEHHCWESEEC